MSGLKIGWCEVDITPDKKASLAGQFAKRISQYVEKPIAFIASGQVGHEGGDLLVRQTLDCINKLF